MDNYHQGEEHNDTTRSAMSHAVATHLARIEHIASKDQQDDILLALGYVLELPGETARGSSCPVSAFVEHAVETSSRLMLALNVAGVRITKEESVALSGIMLGRSIEESCFALLNQSGEEV